MDIEKISENLPGGEWNRIPSEEERANKTIKIAMSRELIAIDDTPEAISKFREGLEAGDELNCAGCPNEKYCGPGKIVGVAVDPYDKKEKLWIKLEKRNGKISCCDSKYFAQIPEKK
jgi:hypothetical protein